MVDNPRFQVRDDASELEKLDEAIKKLGYKDRADWYREMKRQTLQKAVMSNMRFVHIITTLDDDNDAVRYHDKMFQYKVTEEIESIDLNAFDINNKDKIQSLILSLMTARSHKRRLILHIEDFQKLTYFPQNLVTVVMGNCVFIGSDGIEISPTL